MLAIRFFIFYLIALCPAFLLANDSTVFNKKGWKVITVKNFPDKREDCGFVKCKGKFYLLGGRGERTVEVFDPVKKDWTHLPPAPIEMHHFQPVLFRDKIYIIGGMAGRYPHEKPLANIYIFDPLKSEWSKGDTIPENRRRGSGGTVVYKDKIYFVAGIQDGHYEGNVNWFDSYDPSTGKWTALPDAPNVRDHFNAVVIGSKMYVAGGRKTLAKTKEVAPLMVATVDVFDFRSGQWSSLPADENLPTKRAGCAAVNYKGKLVVIGGESIIQKRSHSEVEAYDPKKHKWVKLPNLVIGRHDTGAVVYKNKIYIAAGSANSGGGPDENTIEVME